MELSEIRKLIKEYHSLENAENDNFFSEMQKQTIIKTLNSSIDSFSTIAKDFEYALREIFVQNRKVPFTAITLRTQIKNIQIDNSSFCYHLKLIMSTDLKESHLNQTLANLVVLSKNEIDDSEFLKNQYTINLLPILLETKINNCNLIHRACWNIVANNLNPKFEQKYIF